jgi:hypothetical protein
MKIVNAPVAEMVQPSLKEKLWHRMRRDLLSYVPELELKPLLMCCACGRFLPLECFTLEHLIPKRALRNDPAAVRGNPDTPTNVRARNLLLCQEPLKQKGKTVYSNGCNSWKGKHYDKCIEELVDGTAWGRGKPTQVHLIAALCLAYLALVSEFGYVAVLMRSGRLLRQQFFQPSRFDPDLPLRSQMVLGTGKSVSPDAPMWGKPFSFGFVDGGCTVGVRNFSIIVPTSQDLRLPIARHLKIVPSKYKMRPDFDTFFD